MEITTIGLDLAKNVFQVHGADRYGKPQLTRQLRRRQVRQFFARLEPCLVAMEATRSANYWARVLRELGHEVRLIAPQFVKPYVKANKTDRVTVIAFDASPAGKQAVFEKKLFDSPQQFPRRMARGTVELLVGIGPARAGQSIRLSADQSPYVGGFDTGWCHG